MAYSIRRATPEDVADLTRLTLDMAVETENRVLDGAVIGRGIRTTFERPNLADYYVVVQSHPPPATDNAGSSDAATSASPTGAAGAEEKGNGGDAPWPTQKPLLPVVGFMMTTQEYKPRTATTVQLLQTVYIAPAHRRHGLFRRLYEYLRTTVEADPSCEGIWLYVEEANTPAIKAYTRMGMHREDTHMMRWSKCGF